MKPKPQKRLKPVKSLPLKEETNNGNCSAEGDDGGHSFTCFKCGEMYKSHQQRKNHILSHYYSTFHNMLPTARPYTCPQCLSHQALRLRSQEDIRVH